MDSKKITVRQMEMPYIHRDGKWEKKKLPQPEKKKTYLPTDNEIKALPGYLKEYDKEMYIACNLATFIDMLPKEGNLVSINPSRVSDRFTK